MSRENIACYKNTVFDYVPFLSNLHPHAYNSTNLTKTCKKMRWESYSIRAPCISRVRPHPNRIRPHYIRISSAPCVPSAPHAPVASRTIWVSKVDFAHAQPQYQRQLHIESSCSRQFLNLGSYNRPLLARTVTPLLKKETPWKNRASMTFVHSFLLY